VAPAGSDLRRHLGPWAATSLLVGGVVGSGIFLVPSGMLAAAPSVPVCLGIWLAAGLLSLAGALTFAELASMLPHAGGQYVYLHAAFGPALGFVYGWVLFAVIQSGSVAAVATAFGTYASVVVPALPPWALAALAIAVTCAINLRTSFVAIRVQGVVTAAKCAALVALGLAAIAMAAAGGGTAGGGAAALGQGLARPLTVSGVASAMLAALWAYDGWHAVCLCAGVLGEAVRSLARAGAGGLAIVVVLYVVVFSSYVVCLGPERVAGSDRPAVDVGREVLGSGGEAAMAALIALSTFGTVLGMMFTCPRTYYAMARDGLFFAAAARVHPRWGTPHVAVLLQGAWATVLAVAGTFDALLGYVLFASWLFYALAGAALIKLRRRTGGPGPWPTPGYPATPLAFMVVSLALALAMLAKEPKQSALGLVMILAGLLIHAAAGPARPGKAGPAE
jgi:APA family basic amino acid/polyamine antiporter